jgi:hypothetical protein
MSDQVGPCSGCGTPLPTCATGQDAVVCSACGATTHFEELNATVTSRVSLAGKADTPEGYRTSRRRRRPMIEFFTGHSYTRDDGTWAQRHWLADRVRDIWHEIVIRANGQRIEKTESLRKRRGHGSDRRRS